jgi:hypothetical protein
MIRQKALLACILNLLVIGIAQAIPIDLNNFFADPAVAVAPDGSSATIAEDAFLNPVLLSNDPFLGDPEVIFAGLDYLIFDYDFTEGSVGNNDEFGVFIIDVDTGLSPGPAFEFFTQDSSSGMISFDLSGLIGKSLGMQFQLSALSGDIGLDSTVTISNLHTEPISEPVPEPNTIWLMVIGLYGLVLYNNKCLRQKRRS